MKHQTANWIKNPSKKQLILFTILSTFGIVLTIAVITDLFTENPLKRKNLMLFLLGVGSMIATLKLHLAYWKKSRLDEKIKF
mgnify:CR=1 FL=1